MKWISINDRLPDSILEVYLVLDELNNTKIAQWSNRCVCEYTKSTFQNIDRCRCGNWFNQCRSCQTLHRNFIPQKRCGNPKETDKCSWKFIDCYSSGDCCSDDVYYEVNALYWMPLPPSPDKDQHFEGCVGVVHICNNWPIREVCERGIHCTQHKDYRVLYNCVDNCPLKVF